MEIKTYNKAQLNDLILSDEFKRMPVIPISTHRAISHINNPRASPDDILMIIAYENDEMVGYLGVLADKIYNTKREEYKCGWLSCMWVNPLLRGKGIAKQLLATAFKSWNDHILVTEFTPEAKGLYDRSANFNDLRTNHGLRCYLRFNLHEVLPRKNEKYKKYASILHAADAIANIPNNARLFFHRSGNNSQIEFKMIDSISPDLENYIQSKSKDSFESRTAADLTWISNYPWLLRSPSTDESKRYHFSSVAENFSCIQVEIRNENKIAGYLYLTIRDGHLKVAYAYFEKAILPDVVEYINDVMVEKELNMLTVFHKDIVEYLSTHSHPYIYNRPIKRNYIITKALDAHFPDKQDLIIQDGDADCAFT
jgi:GNAT superfamily N-acetyltransferase